MRRTGCNNHNAGCQALFTNLIFFVAYTYVYRPLLFVVNKDYI